MIIFIYPQYDKLPCSSFNSCKILAKLFTDLLQIHCELSCIDNFFFHMLSICTIKLLQRTTKNIEKYAQGPSKQDCLSRRCLHLQPIQNGWIILTKKPSKMSHDQKRQIIIGNLKIVSKVLTKFRNNVFIIYFHLN